MRGAKNTINMDHRQAAGVTKIVRCYNPHTVVGVGMFSGNGEPVNESALVELIVECEREEKEDTSDEQAAHGRFLAT